MVGAKIQIDEGRLAYLIGRWREEARLDGVNPDEYVKRRLALAAKNPSTTTPFSRHNGRLKREELDGGKFVFDGIFDPEEILSHGSIPGVNATGNGSKEVFSSSNQSYVGDGIHLNELLTKLFGGKWHSGFKAYTTDLNGKNVSIPISFFNSQDALKSFADLDRDRQYSAFKDFVEAEVKLTFHAGHLHDAVVLAQSAPRRQRQPKQNIPELKVEEVALQETGYNSLAVEDSISDKQNWSDYVAGSQF